MSGFLAQKQNGSAGVKILQLWILSLIAALIVTGLAALALAWIMVRHKLPLFAAIPMASIAVGAGSFCAGFMQGAVRKQKGSISAALLIALILAAICVIAGFPSWQAPYFTLNTAARSGIILIASVLGYQLGKKLSAPARHSARRRK